MTAVAVVVVMGLLALVLLRSHVFRPVAYLCAAVWGFLLGATPAGPPVNDLLDRIGGSLWQGVTSL